jgi:hypothetical protein
MQNLHNNILATCILACLTTHSFVFAEQSPSPPDIIGIKLGMSLDDTKRILSSQSPTLVVSEPTDNVPLNPDSTQEPIKFIYGLNAAVDPTKSDSPNIEVITYSAPNNHIIGGIARYYKWKDPITYSSLKNALIEKYGEPTFIDEEAFYGGDAKYVLSWSKTPNGQPTTDLYTTLQCSGNKNYKGTPVLGDIRKLAYMRGARQYYRFFPSHNYDNCGFTLVYQINVINDTPVLAKDYVAILYDGNEVRRYNQITFQRNDQIDREDRKMRIRKASDAPIPVL